MDKIVISADEAKKKSLKELLKKLSSSKKGISSSQAQKRLQEYGPNEISEEKPSNTSCLRRQKFYEFLSG